jgi:hypothetical protein
MTLDVIEPMVRDGELPHLARLAAEGSWGRLGTISPTNSSLLWTSIATGCHHRDHGVDGFQFYRLPGCQISRSAVRRLKKVGLKGVLRVLERLGLMTSQLFDGRHIRRKPFWDIFSEADRCVGIVNWWHSWPAEPVNGFIVSDRLFHWRAAAAGGAERPDAQLTFPEDLVQKVGELAIGPQEVPLELIRPYVNLDDVALREFLGGEFERHELRSEVPFLVALDQSCWRAFEHCLDSFPEPAVAAVYFRSPDIAQHCAFAYTAWASQLRVSEQERRAFGQAVPQAYRSADEMIGRVMARMRPEDSLMVMSDHGFAYQQKRGKYGHARGEPPGVLYLWGEEFRAGHEVHDADIYDVAPTLLRISGFPSARDMRGEPIAEALTTQFSRQRPPLGPVATYGPRLERHDIPARSSEVDEKIVEHLRALGYLE